MLVALAAHAQPTLPMPSPACTLSQTIGLTQVTVAYSRPGAKDRVVFGDLVPFDEMWRTGANKATQLTFGTEVKINSQTIPAGSYSLFTIPGKTEWTIVINKDTELWGTGGYKQENDVLRFKVKSEKLPYLAETFTIDFQQIEATKAILYLQWENTRVSFDIEVDSEAAAWANIEKEIKAVEGSWRVYVRAADYVAGTGKNLDKALEWTEKALEMEEYWWTYSVQAEIYAAMGDHKQAQKSLQKAIDLGSEIPNWSYGETLAKQMQEYQAAAAKK